jgi:hypothetical protein
MQAKSRNTTNTLVAAFTWAVVAAHSSTVLAGPVRMVASEFKAFGAFYSIDVTTGQATQIGTMNSFYTDMDFSPSGVLYSATTSLMEINPATGLAYRKDPLTYIGAPAEIISGVTFSSKGEMYGIGSNDGNLWRIDPVTATARFVGTSGQSIFALQFGPRDKLFGAGAELWNIDPSNGKAALIGPIGGNVLISGLDYAPDGVLYGNSDRFTTDSLYRIDPWTGRGTLIGPTGGNLEGIASFPELAPVPEPRSWVLFGLGMVLCVWLREKMPRGPT